MTLARSGERIRTWLTNDHVTDYPEFGGRTVKVLSVVKNEYGTYTYTCQGDNPGDGIHTFNDAPADPSVGAPCNWKRTIRVRPLRAR